MASMRIKGPVKCKDRRRVAAASGENATIHFIVKAPAHPASVKPSQSGSNQHLRSHAPTARHAACFPAKPDLTAEFQQIALNSTKFNQIQPFNFIIFDEWPKRRRKSPPIVHNHI